MNQKPNEGPFEVEIKENFQMLKVQIVLSVMKTLVYETEHWLQQSIQQIPYSNGKNTGVSLYNGSGRTVNLICEHSANGIVGFFGTHADVDGLGHHHVTNVSIPQIYFGEEYLTAANVVMDYLVLGDLPK